MDSQALASVMISKLILCSKSNTEYVPRGEGFQKTLLWKTKLFKHLPIMYFFIKKRSSILPILNCSLLRGTSKVTHSFLVNWAGLSWTPPPHWAPQLKTKVVNVAFFFCLTHTLTGTPGSLLWLTYCRESGEMNLLLPRRGYTPQTNPSIQAGRHRAVTKSFLELLKPCAALIVVGGTSRESNRERKHSSHCLPQNELWDCNCCYDLRGQNREQFFLHTPQSYFLVETVYISSGKSENR